MVKGVVLKEGKFILKCNMAEIIGFNKRDAIFEKFKDDKIVKDGKLIAAKIKTEEWHVVFYDWDMMTEMVKEREEELKKERRGEW